MALSAPMQRLVNNVSVHVPGALANILQLETFNTLDEFFKDSNVWRENVNMPVLGDNVTTTYTVTTTETPATINRFMSAVDGSKFPVLATMQTPGTIVLDHPATKADTYVVTLALTVADPTNSDNYPYAPAWIINKYFNGLIEGVLGRLQSQPAKPYTNERMSIYHLRRFRAAVALARVEANHLNTYERPAWVFPQSFSVRRRRG